MNLYENWNVWATGQASVTTITAPNAGTALLRFVRRQGWRSWGEYRQQMRRRLPFQRLTLNVRRCGATEVVQVPA